MNHAVISRSSPPHLLPSARYLGCGKWVAASLYDWLVANPPEVVLLHIGTNELDVFGVEEILNVIDSYSTDITVVLARIINRATYHQPTTEFYAAVAAMAQARVSNGDKILIVDHESALIYPDDMEDELHPNNTGFTKMAVVWFDGLTAFLPACVLPQRSYASEHWLCYGISARRRRRR